MTLYCNVAYIPTAASFQCWAQHDAFRNERTSYVLVTYSLSIGTFLVIPPFFVFHVRYEDEAKLSRKRHPSVIISVAPKITGSGRAAVVGKPRLTKEGSRRQTGQPGTTYLCYPYHKLLRWPEVALLYLGNTFEGMKIVGMFPSGRVI